MMLGGGGEGGSMDMECNRVSGGKGGSTDMECNMVPGGLGGGQYGYGM